jgi:3-oxoacyl-[acyl-carrier-protein] synthase-3
MWALNYAWMSILTGKYSNAVCVGTEKLASWMTSKIFEEESKHLEAIGKNPFIAFEKEFLRWMLSDGAAAALIMDRPNSNQLSLRIDWIEIRSYANEVETCMFAGGGKDANGDIIPWRDYSGKEWGDETVFALQQDSRLLEKNITKFGMQFLNDLIAKYKLDFDSIDYFLPHLSSEFFRGKIKESLLENNVIIPDEKWFTNLTRVGNVAAASGFLALEELLYSGKLKTDDHLLVMIPESARFSYTYIHLTVV